VVCLKVKANKMGESRSREGELTREKKAIAILKGQGNQRPSREIHIFGWKPFHGNGGGKQGKAETKEETMSL